MDEISVGQKIRTLREQRKLRQADLAAEVGISRSHLTKIETGQDRPGRDLLMAFATYFEVSLDWLAEGKGDSSPARAMNDKEALLLFAYRHLPEDEAEAHLHLMLRRVKPDA